MEEGEHSRVLRQHLRGEGRETNHPGRLGQSLQQYPPEPAMLKGIGHDERHLGVRAARGAVVPADRHQLSGALDDQRETVAPIQPGQVIDLVGAQGTVRVEVAQEDGAIGEQAMKLDERSPVRRGDRP